MEKILTVNNLRISFNSYKGEVEAVRGITFHANKGETVAIVGESGSGKSVTAKSIMGLIDKETGEIKEGSEILYRGRNILDYTPEQWSQYRGGECSMIFQDALTSLNPTMKIGKQITENILNHHSNKSKAEANKLAKGMLSLTGLPDVDKTFNRYPFELSGGMRQRVMISIALASNSKILIADEPTTALDVTVQAQIISLLKSIQEKLETTILFITHDLGVVAHIADRIVVMYSGQIIEQGTVNEIFYDSKHPYTSSLLKSAPNLEMDRDKGLEAIEGAPPSLINLPKGCAFARRCNHCMKICAEKEPETYDFSETQYAKCWLYHPQFQKLKDDTQKAVSDIG